MDVHGHLDGRAVGLGLGVFDIAALDADMVDLEIAILQNVEVEDGHETLRWNKASGANSFIAGSSQIGWTQQKAPALGRGWDCYQSNCLDSDSLKVRPMERSGD
jgi:hypothetical protein